MNLRKLSQKISFILFTLSILSNNINSQWVQQISGTNYSLECVYFVNENTGFISAINTLPPWDSKILRTTNGGNLWVAVRLFYDFLPSCFYFFNDNTGLAAGGFYASEPPIIYKTTNGGLNWYNISSYTFPGA